MDKNKIGNLLLVFFFLGLMYQLLLGIFKTNGREYLNSAEGLFIFSGSMYLIMVGALCRGEIGARGVVVRREDAPLGYWFLLLMNALFATLLLWRGIKKLAMV